MRSLEQVIISTLKNYQIDSERKDEMTGVWVDDEKICAMGVRLSRWVTMHGFAGRDNRRMLSIITITLKDGTILVDKVPE